MSIKRMSLRFNLDKEDERKAWEYLESITESKNKAVINIIKQAADNDRSIAEIIQETIKACLADAAISMPVQQNSETAENEENELVMEAMDNFLC